MSRYYLMGFSLSGECSWRKIEVCKDCLYLKTKYKFLFFGKHFICDTLIITATNKNLVISNPDKLHVDCPLWDMEKARKIQLGLYELADNGELIG